ncbi:MAG: hypothetical protein ACI85Q_002199 [Salibacteraceae bacterium]
MKLKNNTAMKVRITSLLLFFSMAGMTQDIYTEMEITILPYKQVTNGAFYKVIVLSSPECAVEYLSDFEYQWGFSYKLRVMEVRLEHPLSDASSCEYQLLQVISKTAVAEDFSFKMRLSRDLYLGNGTDQVNNFTYINDSTYRYMDEVNIEYSKDKATILNDVIQKNKYVKGSFEFVNTHTIRLK